MNDHILELVLSHTSTGKDYKNYCLVSKAWYTIVGKLFPGGDKFCNHLLTLMMKFPNGSSVDNNWSYARLSYNPRITLDYIKANIDKPWNFIRLSQNTILTEEFVENTAVPWRYRLLNNNPNIGIDFMIKNINKIDQTSIISNNKNITWEIVCKNPNINWDYNDLSLFIPWNVILENPTKPWNYTKIFCVNSSVTWDDVQKFPEHIRSFCICNPNALVDIEKYGHLIDYNNLSNNPMLTEKYILKHLDKPWNYDAVSGYIDKITWDLLSLTLDKPWHYYLLSFRINISLENFKRVMDKPWDYKVLSKKVTWDFILELPDKPWDYNSLSANKNITLNIILNNLDKNWNYYYISCKEELTWRDIVNHPEIPWDFSAISLNFKK